MICYPSFAWLVTFVAARWPRFDIQIHHEAGRHLRAGARRLPDDRPGGMVAAGNRNVTSNAMTGANCRGNTVKFESILGTSKNWRLPSICSSVICDSKVRRLADDGTVQLF
jgi:hypothetical protein